MAISNLNNTHKSLSFRGYDKHLDEKGHELHRFYYPHSSEYNLQLERCLKDKSSGEIMTQPTLDIEKSSIDVSIPEGIGDNYDVYYRFKLSPKDKDKKTVYATDNGLLKSLGKVNGSEEPFNQIYPDRIIVSKPGRMQLQLPDMYYPGIEYKDGVLTPNEAMRAKALSSVRTHVSKLGGTLNGMTYMLPQKAKEGYTRIVGTPLTKDEVSSHLYWTQNAYQMSSSLGGMQDMKRFQQALFKNGINFVTDAALVNEGLQGIHFSNLLKWGEQSPFFNWFKTFDLDANLLSLGVLPANTENVRMRIVNSPIVCKSNPVSAKTYDPKKPTYVQLYDARLVSGEQLRANKPFSKYDKTTDNHYEITSYDDAIIPYYFEVDPMELASNIKKHGGAKEGALSDIGTIMNLLNFSKFKVGEREDGGVELWDGNVDIAKLNFSIGNYDTELLNKTSDYEVKKKVKEYKQGIREVQDYAVLSGNYWTKTAADIQLEYAAGAFKKVKTVDDAMKAKTREIGKTLPPSVASVVNREIIKNVLNNDYKLFKLNNLTSYTVIDEYDNKTTEQILNYDNYVTKSVMNLPLEVLDTDNDVAALLSSGYLTKRASTNEQIGLTRFDIYKSDYPNLTEKYSELYKKTDEMLATDVFKFVDNVLSTYEGLADSQKLKTLSGRITTFGAYAINSVASDLVKYALIKSLDKDANITVEKDGTLNFDNIDRSRINIKALDIQDVSPEDEAKNLIDKMQEGLDALNRDQKAVNELATAMSVRLKGLNENSFKLADMIIDRTESGVGLRVDATKDVAAFDSVRNTTDDVAKAWDDVLNFWTKYVREGVQKENPHAFTTAEVTDTASFLSNPVGDLKSGADAERKLLERGITSIANYSYFFTMPTEIYSKNPETGREGCFKKVNSIKSKIDCLDNPRWRDNSGLIFEGMPDSSIHSYTFVGNHDKPRILHVLGLDMGLYNSAFDNENDQKVAMDVLMADDENMEYEYLAVDGAGGNPISGPAIAMGSRIKNVLRNLNKAAENDKDNPITPEQKAQNEKNFEKMSYAIARLARGIYKVDGSDQQLLFHPNSFGEKPFDVVIHDVVKTANLDMEPQEQKKLENKIFDAMLQPAIKKFKSIYKMLVLLPGDPTDFAGDKEGLTGFESKCKNLTQQNRNAVRWEWLDSENQEYYKDFIAKYNKEINDIMGLRTKSELSALNNGHTVSLVNYNTAKEFAHPASRTYSANFRYNSEGSQVITIFGQPDLKDSDPSTIMGDKKVEIPYINLGKVMAREGLSAGLDTKTVFVNIDGNDKAEYRVEKADIDLPKDAPKGTDYTKFAYEDYDKNKGYILEKTPTFVLRKYVGNKLVPIQVGKSDDNAIVLYKR